MRLVYSSLVPRLSGRVGPGYEASVHVASRTLMMTSLGISGVLMQYRAGICRTPGVLFLVHCFICGRNGTSVAL